MRAVFTVNIPSVSTDSYPPNDEFLKRVRAYGWELIENSNLEEAERANNYEKRASVMWKHLPEILKEEQNYVIFFGKMHDNNTDILITRLTDGQARFRLIHQELDRLQSSTLTVVRKLLAPMGNQPALEISNQRIEIYERGYNHIIIEGRVIPKPLAEAWKVDKRNVLLTLAGLLFMIPSLIGLFLFSPEDNRIIYGTLERASTAFLTTMIVSLVGFIQTYVEIRGSRLIDWSVASDEKKHNRLGPIQ